MAFSNLLDPIDKRHGGFVEKMAIGVVVRLPLEMIEQLQVRVDAVEHLQAHN